MDLPGNVVAFKSAGAVLSNAFPLGHTEVIFEYLPEMKAVYRKRYGQGEEFWTPEKGPEEDPPVIETLLSDYPQYENRLESCLQVTVPHVDYLLLNRPVLTQELLDPGVEMFRGINGIDDIFITVDEFVIVHPRNEVHGKVSVVSSHRI